MLAAPYLPTIVIATLIGLPVPPKWWAPSIVIAVLFPVFGWATIFFYGVRVTPRALTIRALQAHFAREEVGELRRWDDSVALIEKGTAKIGAVISPRFWGERGVARLADALATQVIWTTEAAPLMAGESEVELVSEASRTVARRRIVLATSGVFVIVGISAGSTVAWSGIAGAEPLLIYGICLGVAVGLALLYTAWRIPKDVLTITSDRVLITRAQDVSAWSRTVARQLLRERGWIVLAGENGPLAWLRERSLSEEAIDRIRAVLERRV